MSFVDFREELHPRAPKGAETGGRFITKGVSSNDKGFSARPQLAAMVQQVRSVLTPDLLKPKYREKATRATAGHCYAASEALYHMLGGQESGWKPMVLSHDDFPDGLAKGESHWFLQDKDGNILDPTADQFDGDIPYDAAVGKGFLTKQPSKRAATIIARVQEAAPEETLALDKKPVLEDKPLPMQSIVVPAAKYSWGGAHQTVRFVDVEVLVNPSERDVQQITDEVLARPDAKAAPESDWGQMRVMRDAHDNVFLWPAVDATHTEVEAGIGTLSSGNVKFVSSTQDDWLVGAHGISKPQRAILQRGQQNAREAAAAKRKAAAKTDEKS